LSQLVIRVKNPQNLASWYRRVMGMLVREDEEEGSWTAGYSDPGVTLVFKDAGSEAKAYESSRESCYWKIGVCVSDVDLARERIIKQGTSVSVPAQFLDVGYLCHLTDPNGFTIELLQHKFEQNFQKIDVDDSFALGQPAVIGQITTRSTNIEKSLELYRDNLGMKLLSIQDIKPYGFTLYFLGFTDEEPPNSDIHDVSIREWLWQRPYTTLEIQHKPNSAPCLPMNDEGEGVDHIMMKVKEINYEVLSKMNIETGTDGEYQDHDGVRLKIQEEN